MAPDHDDRLRVSCAYLAVLAAATIVASMQVPMGDDPMMSLLGAIRFVVAVAAVIFGFIAWFERRYPLDDRAFARGAETVEVDLAGPRRS